MALLSLFMPNAAWKTGRFPPPWDAAAPSIYAHVRASTARGENPNEADLPDEARQAQGRRIRFAPGAMDNLLGRTNEDPQDLVAAVRRVLGYPSRANVAALYRRLLDDGAIGQVDGAIALIFETPPPADRFAMFFEWLARNSPDREPVKFAVAMLGMLQGEDFKALFLALGVHEEFTKYCAVALRHSLPPEEGWQAMFGLARQVDGWGRIDLVDRLAGDGDAAFRHWLVRDGFRNAVMDEYLACIAAREGRLVEQLAAPSAADDDALLDGAAGIFKALVSGGPAEDMGDYADGATAAFRWFDLVETRPVSLLRASAAQALGSYAGCSDDTGAWPAKAARESGERATRYLGRDGLPDLVLHHLKSGSGYDLWLAKTLAPDLGIDPWPHVLAAQMADAGHDGWYDLMRTDDPDRIDQVLALAVAQLPLDRIAAGPADELGLGPEWAPHSALDFIVQALGRFPGKGWPLIAAALHSPVVRNRNMAAKALEGWAKADWPPEALQAVRQAAQAEPDADLKARLERLPGPEPFRD